MTQVGVVIPLYNHGTTIYDVARRALAYCPHVWVVDDGSTDGGADSLTELPVQVIRLPANAGKGKALLAGADALRRAGCTHMLTLDADDQHYPEDIPAFLEAIAAQPHAFIVGARDFSGANIPKSSRFGRSFSAFWMFVQTGQRVSDMQSGYRAYPLAALECLSLRESRYSFEIDVLVQAAWAGFAIREIPVRVRYPRREERVSHFHPLCDNMRITLLNTRLTVRALLPVPFRHHALDAEGHISLLSPCKSLALLLKKASPVHLAVSAGVSLGICTLPLLGLQSILLLCAINALRLDRLCALVVIPLSWPPLLPGVCVLVGYRLWHGQWLTAFTVQTLGYEAGQRFLEWIVGSLVLAPLAGTALAIVVWLMAQGVRASCRAQA